ncbi:FMR [Mytilus coruscus]|uniref:FMR n=1 Tax=Mytilus coruscus TaxID=42192 RepID=A0A6J8CD39_MYTCO|nr:FMR [Mytilus coruscus]
MNIKPGIYKEKFKVPLDLVGLAIGTEGANIEKSRKIKGVLSVNTNKTKRGGYSFTVVGESPEAVKKARSVLELRQQVYTIPKHLAGKVIGKSGQAIEEVINRSLVNRITKHEENDDVILNIFGPPEAIENAKLLLHYKLDQINTNEPFFTETFMVPLDLIGLTIGAKGANIKKSQQISGVFSVNQEKQPGGCRFRIFGETLEAVKKARSILELSQHAYRVPKHYIAGPVIGKFEQAIKDVINETLVKTITKHYKKNDVILTIIGPSEAIENAKHLLKYKLDETGGNHFRRKDEYRTEEKDRYRIEEKGGNNTEEKDGYSTEENDGYSIEENDRYSTVEQDGYITDENDEYSTAEKDGYRTEEKDGYRTEEKDGYSTVEKDGYSTVEKEIDLDREEKTRGKEDRENTFRGKHMQRSHEGQNPLCSGSDIRSRQPTYSHLPMHIVSAVQSNPSFAQHTQCEVKKSCSKKKKRKAKVKNKFIETDHGQTKLTKARLQDNCLGKYIEAPIKDKGGNGVLKVDTLTNCDDNRGTCISLDTTGISNEKGENSFEKCIGNGINRRDHEQYLESIQTKDSWEMWDSDEESSMSTELKQFEMDETKARSNCFGNSLTNQLLSVHDDTKTLVAYNVGGRMESSTSDVENQLSSVDDSTEA